MDYQFKTHTLCSKEYTAALAEIRNASGLDSLDMETAKSLIGKRIHTLYYGYKGQDGVDNFVLGEIVSQYDLAKREDVSHISGMKGAKTRADWYEICMTPSQLSESKEKMILITTEGRNTHIWLNPRYDIENGQWVGKFVCSDADRAVFYRLADQSHA